MLVASRNTFILLAEKRVPCAALSFRKLVDSDLQKTGNEFLNARLHHFIEHAIVINAAAETADAYFGAVFLTARLIGPDDFARRRIHQSSIHSRNKILLASAKAGAAARAFIRVAILGHDPRQQVIDAQKLANFYGGLRIYIPAQGKVFLLHKSLKLLTIDNTIFPAPNQLGNKDILCCRRAAVVPPLIVLAGTTCEKGT